MGRRLTYYCENSLSAQSYDFLENSLDLAGKSPFKGDVEFYLRLAHLQAGAILDVGTGTERVAWPLAEAGFDVLGADLSGSMLRQSERKGHRYPDTIGARIRFVQQNMNQLDVSRCVPLVIVPFRSFNHLLPPIDQRTALGALRRHMTPHGLLVIHMPSSRKGSDQMI